MTLTESLKQDIKILKYKLKDEKSLKEILKKRFTKKELKLYLLRCENLDNKEICNQMKIDKKRYAELLDKIIKKVNYEKLKNELSEA